MTNQTAVLASDNAGAIVGAVMLAILLLPVLFLWQMNTSKRRRRRHVASHRTLPEEDFLWQAGVTGDMGHIAIGVREAFGLAMGVPPGTVHATDDLDYVFTFGSSGLVFIDIVTSIEEVLKVSIPDELWKEWRDAETGKTTVKDMIHRLAQNWHRFGPECKRPVVRTVGERVKLPRPLP